MRKLKYFSTFTGIGGLDMGLEKIGAKCVGFSEIRQSSIDIYKSHYPDHKCYGDITKLDIKNLPDFDIFTGGFPCQSFSIAGVRKGFKDRRGQMIFHIFDILREKKPEFVVLENVKGILTHDGGKTYKSVFKLLWYAGYFVRVVLLNSANYGSAQARERILFLCRRDKDFDIKNPEVKNNRKVFRDIREKDGEFRYLSEKSITRMGKKKKAFIQIGGYDRVNTLTTGISSSGRSTVVAQENDGRFRHLTVLEGERLQGFPEIEKSCIIEVCQVKQKNVGVEKKNGQKRQNVVGIVGRENLQENVESVELNIDIRDQQIKKPVQQDVLINYGDWGVEIHSQGKLLLNARDVKKKDWSHPHIKIEDFVQLLVGVNSIKEKIIKLGGEGLLQKEQSLIHQRNGKLRESLFGENIMQPVRDVKNDLIILKGLLKSTISNHLGIRDLEQNLIILSSFVIRVISGFIPKEILQKDLFTIEIKTKKGWTEGAKTGDRWFAIGNAVNCKVSEYLFGDYLQELWFKN